MNPAEQLKATAGANETWGLTPGDPPINFAGFEPAVPARWGGAVYVPDFARRVRVTLTEQPQCDGVAILPGQDVPMVPFAGDPTASLVWFDDTGAVIDAAIQGKGVDRPVEWHPVPAGATMLGVYTKAGACGCPEMTINITVTGGNSGTTPELNAQRDPADICTWEVGIIQPNDAVDLVTWGELKEALEALGLTITGGPADLGFPIGTGEDEEVWEFTGTVSECVDGRLVLSTDDMAGTGPAGVPATFTGAINDEAATFDSECADDETTYQGLVHWRISP
jgi:hypothetical protein